MVAINCPTYSVVFLKNKGTNYNVSKGHLTLFSYNVTSDNLQLCG